MASARTRGSRGDRPRFQPTPRLRIRSLIVRSRGRRRPEVVAERHLRRDMPCSRGGLEPMKHCLFVPGTPMPPALTTASVNLASSRPEFAASSIIATPDSAFEETTPLATRQVRSDRLLEHERGHHRHRGVVAVQPLGGAHVSSDPDPCSSRSRSNTRLALWRCLARRPRSSRSHWSMNSMKPSSFGRPDGCGAPVARRYRNRQHLSHAVGGKSRSDARPRAGSCRPDARDIKVPR